MTLHPVTDSEFELSTVDHSQRTYIFVVTNQIKWNHISNQIKWKKVLRETKTLSAGCSKAEPKIFAPPQTPFLGAKDGQNLISWRWSLPLPTNPVWWGSTDAISSYPGNRPTNTHTQTNPRTGPITIHCAAKLSTQCNHIYWILADMRLD